MKYRLKMANLSRNMDLAGVQTNLNELERVYLESEPFLGKLSEQKKESMAKSINYCRGIVDVEIEFKKAWDARELVGPTGIMLQIA